VPVEGGEPLNLTGGDHPNLAHPYRAPLWDAEGRTIYIVGDGALWKVSVDDRNLTRLTRGEGWRIIEPVTAEQGRIWSPDDGRSTVVVILDEGTKRVGFDRVDLRSGGRTRLRHPDPRDFDLEPNPKLPRGLRSSRPAAGWCRDT
jgi:hypothetical protein